MDWSNIDFSSPYETSQNILDGYSFDMLLLEVNCNLREINEATVRAQFEESLKSKIESAREVFEANLKGIVKDARKTRAIP